MIEQEPVKLDQAQPVYMMNSNSKIVGIFFADSYCLSITNEGEAFHALTLFFKHQTIASIYYNEMKCQIYLFDLQSPGFKFELVNSL